MTIENSKHEFIEIDNPYRTYNRISEDWPYHEYVIKEIRDIFLSQPENRVIVIQGKPGSGKTSILKQIKKNPQALGANYIPIHLDSSEYMNRDASELLFSVYKDISDKLSKELKIEIPIFNNCCATL